MELQMTNRPLLSVPESTARVCAALERIAQIDRPLNSIIALAPNSSVRASELDGEINKGIKRSALHGFPILVKDNIDTVNLRTTAGAPFWHDRIPPRNASAIDRVEDSGMVVLAKTNLSEVALGPLGANRSFGNCHNAWDVRRASGGSSSGSAVAVAAGLSDLALGTDTGGSIRIPAALNGVLGLRPSRGRIDTDGVVPLSPTFDTVGPMGRNAADVAALTDILTSNTSFEAATARIGLPLSGLRLGVLDAHHTYGTDVHRIALLESFVSTLASMGAVLERIDFDPWARAATVWNVIAGSEAAATFHDRLTQDPTVFANEVRMRLMAGRAVGSDEIAAAQAERAALTASIAALLVDVDVLVSPTSPTSAPFLGHRNTSSTSVAQFVHPWALHDGPTLTVPVGFDPEGQPAGSSLTARRGEEAVLFQIAYAYQQITEWHSRTTTFGTADQRG
ncbi:hypothetical protein CH267_13245 [Rhodococcus sp. 06-621-2]|nr:hypothetical protein CH267_13245 [Rhodococcus sp. 06-621-2]